MQGNFVDRVNIRLRSLYAFPIFPVSSNILRHIFREKINSKDCFRTIYFLAVYKKFCSEDTFYSQTLSTYCIHMSKPLNIKARDALIRQVECQKNAEKFSCVPKYK